MICLDWSNFEHQKGPFVLGKASSKFIQNRLNEKSKIWRYLQAYWLRNAKYMLSIVKQTVDKRGGDITIEALVEDGMFEEKIFYPVALYAEMLWDCNENMDDIISETALNPYIEFI